MNLFAIIFWLDFKWGLWFQLVVNSEISCFVNSAEVTQALKILNVVFHHKILLHFSGQDYEDERIR